MSAAGGCHLENYRRLFCLVFCLFSCSPRKILTNIYCCKIYPQRKKILKRKKIAPRAVPAGPASALRLHNMADAREPSDQEPKRRKRAGWGDAPPSEAAVASAAPAVPLPSNSGNATPLQQQLLQQAQMAARAPPQV